MTSRERMLRCLEFDHPDRVPRDLWTLPTAAMALGKEKVQAFRDRWPTDMIVCRGAEKQKCRKVKGDAYAVGQHVDEWGCVFENIQAGVHGEVVAPLVAEWSDLDRVEPPRERLSVDAGAVADFYHSTDKFVQAGCAARPFERMQFLRGSENLYMDLAEEPPEFHELIRIVHGFFVEQLEVWGKTQVDTLFVMDDWGSQHALLIAPEQWRRLFKPLYAEYVRIAHDAGKKLMMHSDGHIFEIYGDLVEIGVDAINSQLFCMDIEEIGRRYRGKITFWGEIDRQHVLSFGTVEEAREAVRRVAANLRQPAGGVIAQFELGAGAKLENAEAVFETWEQVSESGGAER